MTKRKNYSSMLDLGVVLSGTGAVCITCLSLADVCGVL